MRIQGVFFILILWASQVRGETAEEIMRQVAVHQDHAQATRAHYIYDQHVKVVIRKPNGKLAREELADLLVFPKASGIESKRESIQGTYLKKGIYIKFQGDPVPDSNTLDGGLAKSFREDLLNTDSKDGLAKDLFPLNSDEQKELRFELHDEEVVKGRPTYRIKFAPADRHEIGWAGEALIDKEELQPVSVYTRLSRKLPFAVRTMLGTDVPGIGFSVQYARVEKDVWFPITFGTEFRLHAVFFINRTISVSMENRNFKQSSVESAIEYGEQDHLH
jgi:hypothetical protein